jgi:hypothetical protein
LGVGLGVGLGLGVPTILAALFFGYVQLKKSVSTELKKTVREEVQNDRNAHDAEKYRRIEHAYLTASPQDQARANRLLLLGGPGPTNV